MTLNKIIKTIARQHNTTPERVRREMEAAIPRKGTDVTLEEFLLYVAGLAKGIS